MIVIGNGRHKTMTSKQIITVTSTPTHCGCLNRDHEEPRYSGTDFKKATKVYEKCCAHESDSVVKMRIGGSVYHMQMT